MIWLFFLSLLSCNAPATNNAPSGITVQDGYHFPYQLAEADQTFVMPHKLEEISGLDLSDDGNTLAAIQDEDGELFFINRYTGEVQSEIKFWKDGDYEGVEFVGDEVYVVKSTGTIYEVLEPGSEDQEVNKYNFFLDDDNDVEGLAHDAPNNRLLLACKAKAGYERDYPHRKGIYAFDLSSKTLSEAPVYFVQLDSIRYYLGHSPATQKLEKLISFFSSDEDFDFSPSAIAIHPLSGHLYITSSVGKLLLVMDTKGQIVHIEKLSKEVHAQPEGICFAADGTLYISNEGKNGKGKIHRFSFRP